MKKLLFLVCFLFTFFSVAKAVPIKEKQKSESLQIAVLKQNKVLFVKFRFEKPTYHYLGYVVRYKKERLYIPIIPGKPCKIPIPLKTRNKDNI